MKNIYKIIFIKNSFAGIIFGLSFVLTIYVFVKAAGLSATSGTPLTASNWNSMISNLFWGSGSGGVYYNGKVGIGTSSPNKSLHIKTSAGANAELDIQSGDLPHWGIYQDESSQDLKIRNGVNKVSISNGGVLNAIGGLCINGDCKTAWSQVGGGGTVNYTGTCDASHKGYSGIIDGIYKICTGTEWYELVILVRNGLSSASPGYTCNTIKTGFPSSADGVYRIDPNGGLSFDSFKTYCDMTTDGGGWTLAGIQVPSNIFTTNPTTDINLANFGLLTDSWRYGNTKIQSFTPTVAWRMQSRNSSTNAVVDTGYFKPACVIDWSVGWNGTTNVSSLNCQNMYTNTAFSAILGGSNVNPSNGAMGIGQNNSGSYCSMRMANSAASIYYAMDCVSQYGVNKILLRVK